MQNTLRNWIPAVMIGTILIGLGAEASWSFKKTTGDEGVSSSELAEELRQREQTRERARREFEAQQNRAPNPNARVRIHRMGEDGSRMVEDVGELSETELRNKDYKRVHAMAAQSTGRPMRPSGDSPKRRSDSLMEGPIGSINWLFWLVMIGLGAGGWYYWQTEKA